MKPPLIELVGEFDRDVEHPNLGLIRRETVSREYYWLDRCYNVFRFHEPSGEIRNYYCNIAMPPKFEKRVLNYVDLDIDVLVWPDGRCEILDREDFELNAAEFGYSEVLKKQVDSSLGELTDLIEHRVFPFNFA